MTETTEPKTLAELERRAAAGDPEAIHQLGVEYDEAGFGTFRVREPDQRKAARLYRQAAEMGDVAAMSAFAGCLSSGRGVRQDLDAALAWKKRAYRLDGDMVVFNIGVTYLKMGKHHLAVRWFRKALDAGDESAGLELAKAELMGLGTRRDVKTAMRRLKKIAWSTSRNLCIADREEAAILGAQVYLDGWLVPRDYNRAVRWLEKAAATDSRTAIGMLADL